MNNSLRKRPYTAVVCSESMLEVGPDTDRESWEMQFESLPNVERVTPELCQPIRKYLSSLSSVDTYSISMAYYLFTGRKGLWVFYGDRGFGLVCWHPNVEGRILVFLPGGLDTGIIHQIMDCMPPPPKGAQLSRVLPEWSDALRRECGLRPCKEEILDWIFPCHLIDVKEVAGLQGGQFSSVRLWVNRAKRYGVQYMPFSSKLHGSSCADVTLSWAKNRNDSSLNLEDYCSPHLYLLKLSGTQELSLEGLAYHIEGHLKGYAIWEKSAGKIKIANCFGGVVDPGIKGLMDFSVYALCQTLARQGVDFVNLGGSETHGLDQFKRKFQPSTSYQLCSMEISSI
ncbi:MAG: DUF2156 domain-containing protein [Alphaproteobacteria bacterium]|nr:MAG: DUF2156 domain-containing protein [Alphaproteobacteria bacterium]